MFINNITLTGHPLLKDFVGLGFSLPNGTDGSGINYIVGQSGAGKTKFFDTFLAGRSVASMANRSKPSQKIDPSAYKIIVVDEDGKQVARVQATELTAESVLKIEKDYMFGSEEIQSSSATGKLEINLRLKNRQGSFYPKIFNNSGAGEARFNILMKKIEDILKSATIMIVYIEEPETYLDPINQVRILRALGNLAKTRQVFISTHSPYIIDWLYLENNASIFKINRIDSSESVIGKFCDSNIAKKINNPGRRAPHYSGIETKSIFFSNCVFVVEGQEDVGLISDYLSDKGIDSEFTFFGYGASSDTKIEGILKLCKDLKIPKVAALFDYNKTGRDSHFQRCFDTYSPEYNIEELKAEDIRDKYDKTIMTRIGAFSYDQSNQKCTLKTDDYGQDFETKILSINEYFKS